MIGKTLAHYEITSQLGKGGMGEVYRAKDKVLGRDVAIKVLPEEFAKDADRVARFQREAKLLASLNHPNIAAIHGLEEANGTHFLVLELIEGDTLADRLNRGAISVEESLKLALQIAEALEAAHEKGVIHRDLKPANIKVTPDGKLKVLDFGLAKAFAGEQAEMNLSNSPTLSDMATMQGVILGTAAYMSPEQARGKPVDKRTDVWAFGCVLYEMLTGKAAFQGEDVTEILAAVVKSGVNLELLPVNIHPRVREVLNRCLQKEQKKRYPEISETEYEIEQVLADPSGVFAQPSLITKPRKKLRIRLPWVAVIAILCLIVAGVAVWFLKPTPPPEPKQVVRFEYDIPEGQQFTSVIVSLFSISPDGKQFAYSTTKGIYLRSVDEFAAKIIPGSDENTTEPLFSPDGKWIAYYSVADKKWKKIPASGGPPQILCDADTPLNGSWGTSDTIVYSEQAKGIVRISANGGTPELLVKSMGLYLVNPQLLPDGKTVFFGIWQGSKDSQVAVQSPKLDKPKILFEGGNAHYLPTGHLVYAARNGFYAVPFDLDKLEVSGDSVPLIESVFRLGGVYTPQFTVSDSGTLIYMPGTVGGTSAFNQFTLVWADRKGNEEPIAADPDDYLFPSISPDATKVALGIAAAGNQDIWIYDLVHKNRTRLTFDEAVDRFPLWSPDGKRIFFMSVHDGKPGIYWKAANGTGTDELLVAGAGGTIYPRSWSNDGKTLIYVENITGTNSDIDAISIEGDHAKKQLLHEKHMETEPRISPDGRWMAYSCDESGQFQIYVRPYPEVNSGKWQVSTDGGVTPLWSPDGRELFYRSGNEFMAIRVNTEPSFSFETPNLLFQGNYVIPGVVFLSNWDISPDGKRFLMIKPATAAGSETTSMGPRKINIVINWFEELKQRVPVKQTRQ
jgi:serine/threonine protein kinase